MNATPFPPTNMDVTFLTEEQIWGDKAFQVIKEYGNKTGISDLAVVLGGFVGNSTTSDNQRAGYIWSASSNGKGKVSTVRRDGGRDCFPPCERLGGARPVMPSSVASKLKPSKVIFTRKIGNVEIVEYGEYPQTIAPNDVAAELEWKLSTSKLKTTGKTYTFDGEKNYAQDNPFKAIKYPEYERNGKRYIRVCAKPYGDNSVLSNGEKIQDGESCWIQVQPIEWLQDPTGIMIARQALFSGVQFDCNKTYDGNFGKTDIKHYLQTYFAKEMMVSRGVDSPSAVINPTTVTLSEHRAAQRRRALHDPSQGL